jgi:hypothetical protein
MAELGHGAVSAPEGVEHRSDCTFRDVMLARQAGNQLSFFRGSWRRHILLCDRWRRSLLFQLQGLGFVFEFWPISTMLLKKGTSLFRRYPRDVRQIFDLQCLTLYDTG